MFGIKSKSRCRVEARLYAESILCMLREMTGSMSNAQDQALAEIFGGIYLMYLARESADFKHIQPYLPDTFLDQTKYFRCAPEGREKRVKYISARLAAYETAEKSLLKQKKNPVEGLLRTTAAPKAGRITLAAENMQPAEFQIIDTIVYQNETYVCLLGKGDEMLTILESKDQPGGSASCSSVEDPVAQAIFDLFKKRTPQLVQ